MYKVKRSARSHEDLSTDFARETNTCLDEGFANKVNNDKFHVRI